MRVLSDFDSGALPPHEVTPGGIRFDLRPGQVILHALLSEISGSIDVELLVDEKNEKMILGQGLVVCESGNDFRTVSLKKTADGVLRAKLSIAGGEPRIATRYPYGRDQLDALLCDTSATDGVRWRFLRGGHRGLPLAEFGGDDGRCPVQYFLAAEDAWETAGSWVADEMVRELARGGEAAERLAATSLVRIAPLVSPYSATREAGSYRTLAGERIYGAATWGDAEPPPEYAMLRDLVEATIRESRLGCMMTIHSWQASRDWTELGTVRTAGENSLSETRGAWADNVMARMIDGVPRGRFALSEKIWHPGLARDYLLAKHNAITFRMEVTTAGQGLDGFRETGRRFLANLADISDWTPACGGK
jgi:hypothetical protein